MSEKCICNKQDARKNLIHEISSVLLKEKGVTKYEYCEINTFLFCVNDYRHNQSRSKENLIQLDSPSNKKYACLKKIHNAHGIYIFHNKSAIYYIGKSSRQGIKKRVIQNFRENDTGGTFRKNYCDIENAGFHSFKNLLADCTLLTIVFSDEYKKIIDCVEQTLINTFQPIYNMNGVCPSLKKKYAENAEASI